MDLVDVHAAFGRRWSTYINYVKLKFAHVNPPGKAKNWWVRRMGVDLGKNVFISPAVVFDPIFPELIHVGEGVFFGWNARIFSHITTPYTNRAYEKFRAMLNDGRLVFLDIYQNKVSGHKLILAAGHIWIEDDVFIGGFTTVRAGLRIGRGATIGSDSLVTKDIPAGALAIGKPAKIREVRRW